MSCNRCWWKQTIFWLSEALHLLSKSVFTIIPPWLSIGTFSGWSTVLLRKYLPLFLLFPIALLCRGYIFKSCKFCVAIVFGLARWVICMCRVCWCPCNGCSNSLQKLHTNRPGSFVTTHGTTTKASTKSFGSLLKQISMVYPIHKLTLAPHVKCLRCSRTMVSYSISPVASGQLTTFPWDLSVATSNNHYYEGDITMSTLAVETASCFFPKWSSISTSPGFKNRQLISLTWLK